MPILTVDWVEAAEASPPADLARRLADAAGRVLEAPAGQTWVRLHRVAPGDYAESGDAEGPAPVFVHVVRYTLPEPGELAEEAGQLARALAEACGRSVDQVHIVYEPDGRGRVAFGGELAT